MLVINQRLDKLAALHSNFIACGMLPSGHAPGRNITCISKSTSNHDEDNDAGPAEEAIVLGSMVLAWTRGMSIHLNHFD